MNFTYEDEMKTSSSLHYDCFAVSFGSEMHLDILGSYASDSGLEDESSRLKDSLSEVSMESSYRSKDSALGDASEISEAQSEISVDDIDDEGEAEETAEEEIEEEDGLTLPSSYTDGGYVNIGEEDVNRVKGLASMTSVSDIPENENENEEVDLEEMERLMSISSYDAKEAIERFFNIDAIACTGMPILHCVRLMCSFLLAGKVGKVLPDSRTRVSVKSLALSCLGHALTIYPEAFLARVMPDEEEDSQKTDELELTNSDQCVRDCCLLAEHSDPQIRGMIANVAGLFIKAALCKSG